MCPPPRRAGLTSSPPLPSPELPDGTAEGPTLLLLEGCSQKGCPQISVFPNFYIPKRCVPKRCVPKSVCPQSYASPNDVSPIGHRARMALGTSRTRCGCEPPPQKPAAPPGGGKTFTPAPWPCPPGCRCHGEGKAPSRTALPQEEAGLSAAPSLRFLAAFCQKSHPRLILGWGLRRGVSPHHHPSCRTPSPVPPSPPEQPQSMGSLLGWGLGTSPPSSWRAGRDPQGALGCARPAAVRPGLL